MFGRISRDYIFPLIDKTLPKYPSLHKKVLNWAIKYNEKRGHRQLGLLLDDLIPEEDDTVQEALRRLTDKEVYDRTFRQRRAMQLSAVQDILPKEQWTTQQEDTQYLFKHIRQILAESKEREKFDGQG